MAESIKVKQMWVQQKQLLQITNKYDLFMLYTDYYDKFYDCASQIHSLLDSLDTFAPLFWGPPQSDQTFKFFFFCFFFKWFIVLYMCFLRFMWMGLSRMDFPFHFRPIHQFP